MSSPTARAIAFTCFCWAAFPPVDAAEIRTWSDTSGAYKREAAFDRVDGETVVLKTSGGDEFTVPLARLSAADQTYVRRTAASQTADDPFQPSAAPSGAALNPQRGSASGGDVRIVVARGVGKTVEDAKKDAYREAVRQVVGAYVEGDTLTRNDELIEDKVLALSGAIVQRADVIPESVTTSAGLTQMRVRAEVKVTDVLKTLAKINVTTTAVRTSDLVAQVTTTADQIQTAEAMLGDAKTWEAFPASFFRMTAVGQPKIVKAKGDEATVELMLSITSDIDKYLAFAKRLAAILTTLDGPKGVFTVDGKKPACDSSEVHEWRDALIKHVLVSSQNRGNGAMPEIAYAFPQSQQEELQSHFASMGPKLAAKSGCQVYCFDQGSSSRLRACGLRNSAKAWYEAIGRKRTEIMVVCLMTQANDGLSRTKWEWFACDQSLFPSGMESPWFRCIECEVSFRGSGGREIASELLPLSQGFGVSQRDWKYYPQVVMLGPMWIEANGEADERVAYVPQFVFPRRIDLSAGDASSITEVTCVVRPRVNPQE